MQMSKFTAANRMFLSLLALLLLMALLTEGSDMCQCGHRCARYKREHHCVRCCTSVMRRRSIPLESYPQDQLDAFKLQHPLAQLGQEQTVEAIPALTDSGKREEQEGERVALKKGKFGKRR